MSLFDKLEVKPKKSLLTKIKETIFYSIFNKPPECGGYKDEWSGEYDCKYSPDIDFECEHCVCVDYCNGFDPRTGEKFKKFKKVIRWCKNNTNE